MDSGNLPVDPMECVAQGAALKASGTIPPPPPITPVGYGTLFGDYYYALIAENSNVPISGDVTIQHRDSNTLCVSVPIIAKRPDTTQSTAEKVVYAYRYLGDYRIFIRPTGAIPLVHVELKLDGDRRLIADLRHLQTGIKQHFEALDALKGLERDCQEHTPLAVGGDEPTPDSTQKGWTTEQLRRLVNVAESAKGLSQGTSHGQVKNAADVLDAALKDAEHNGYSNPNSDCPEIAGRIQDLVDVLRRPGIAVITESQYRDYLSQLETIANSR
jgi:hypothetical protein